MGKLKLETAGKTVTKIYLVFCETWKEGYHEEWVVKAFGSKDRAEEYRNKLNAWFKQWKKKFWELPELSDRRIAIEIGSDLDPNFSDNWDHSMEFTEYIVIEVEYE